MGETIKCACPECKAKYRLPAEAAGRTARCKLCGSKFHVPGAVSLEDSVLNWLDDESSTKEEQEKITKPKVITMPKGPGDSGIRRGIIRMKDQPGTDGSSDKQAAKH